MDIVISLAGSQLIITIAAAFVALWYWRQLRWIREEVRSIHQEVSRIKLRHDLKKR